MWTAKCPNKNQARQDDDHSNRTRFQFPPILDSGAPVEVNDEVLVLDEVDELLRDTYEIIAGGDNSEDDIVADDDNMDADSEGIHYEVPGDHDEHDLLDYDDADLGDEYDSADGMHDGNGVHGQMFRVAYNFLEQHPNDDADDHMDDEDIEHDRQPILRRRKKTILRIRQGRKRKRAKVFGRRGKCSGPCQTCGESFECRSATTCEDPQAPRCGSCRRNAAC